MEHYEWDIATGTQMVNQLDTWMKAQTIATMSFNDGNEIFWGPQQMAISTKVILILPIV